MALHATVAMPLVTGVRAPTRPNGALYSTVSPWLEAKTSVFRQDVFLQSAMDP